MPSDNGGFIFKGDVVIADSTHLTCRTTLLNYGLMVHIIASTVALSLDIYISKSISAAYYSMT